MAKLWPLVRSTVSRRTLFKGAAGVLAAALGGKWLADHFAALDGPAPQAESLPVGEGAAAQAGTLINVAEFKKTLSVEELCQTAEQYFASRDNWDYWLAKPLGNVEDTPDLLNNFSHVLNGLQLIPGMTVLDFGAGSCWATRWLTQLGMEAIALDVSATALKIGQTLYARQPVFGDQPAPRFVVFDGHRIALPEASVDRILCLDTFHHLLNPDEVLREMSRILKPGGIAGFSEPGPHHSRSPQSQAEMRNFRVLEDDIHIRKIWSSAKDAGFAKIRVAVFSPQAYLLDLPLFEDYLEGGAAGQQFAETTRAQMHDRRLFFLQNGGEPPPPDSRLRTGLRAALTVKLVSANVREGEPVVARVTAKNIGKSIWLPRSIKVGGVQLGCHLLDASGKLVSPDFLRQPLTPGEGRPVKPGETVTMDVHIPRLAKGEYLLDFDLVSERVGWFATNGSVVARVKVQVS